MVLEASVYSDLVLWFVGCNRQSIMVVEAPVSDKVVPLVTAWNRRG